jgi:nucleotide-binding universal stress UspA family protein
MKRIRNILVATDFSSSSRPAFRRAVAMAAASRATLWIGHVLPSVPASVGGELLPRVYREMDVFIRGDAEKKLQALTQAAGQAGARAKPLLLRGMPHEAIRRAARARRADLVVLGTHGRTGAARFFIGSIAARVIATAPCPVLTVRPR